MIPIEFAHPHFFYLLVSIPIYWAWYIWKKNQQNAQVYWSSLDALKHTPITLKTRLRIVPHLVRTIILSLIIVILARPQSSDAWKNVETEGIDIVMALDISTSMLAQDLKPDRHRASIVVGSEFIKNRPNDRIGLVVFAGESFTQCPITTDHEVLINQLKNVKTGIIEDGTAIGMGLANAVNRLKDSEAKSKIVILLTDGENNRGDIAPLTAAEIAAEYGIRVYTIGVGTKGQAPYPMETLFGTQTQMVDVNIDEPTLKEISKISGGQYFRALDNKSLTNIYKEIETLEKTKIKVSEFSSKNEEYFWFAVLAGLLILFEFILRNTFFISIF